MYPVKESTLIIPQSSRFSFPSLIPSVRCTISILSYKLTPDSQTTKYNAQPLYGGLPNSLTLPKKQWFHSPHVSYPLSYPTSRTMLNPYEMLPSVPINFYSMPSKVNHLRKRTLLQPMCRHYMRLHPEHNHLRPHLHHFPRKHHPAPQPEIENLAAMYLQKLHFCRFLQRSYPYPVPYQSAIVPPRFLSHTMDQAFQSSAPLALSQNHTARFLVGRSRHPLACILQYCLLSRQRRRYHQRTRMRLISSTIRPRSMY